MEESSGAVGDIRGQHYEGVFPKGQQRLRTSERYQELKRLQEKMTYFSFTDHYTFNHFAIIASFLSSCSPEKPIFIG